MTISSKLHNAYGAIKTAASHKKDYGYLSPDEFYEVDPNDKYNKVLEFDEDVVGVRNWIAKAPTEKPVNTVLNYLISLFPIIRWIYRYNLTWLYGDLIAGITVGIVVVPQGMSYAKIATLPAEYGLYASFVGVFIYCFFATSKDVSIGPVAVMSLQVGRAIIKVTEKYPEYKEDPAIIAITLTLICGGIATGLGLLRLGFILEFIPIPAVMGFMTGSAFSIIVGQLPSLFGIAKRLNTRDSTYKVFINFWKNIEHTKVDVAFGIPCLVILYTLKFTCDYLTKRVPRYKIFWFYLSVLRNGIVIVVATAISYGVYKNTKESPAASLIKTVPSGLKHLGAPKVDKQIVSAIAAEIPVSTIILLLEHISIAKSFGRLNNYKINPNQELIAIGVTNIIGVFFSAYPATGSFSRTALKAKCGVRTPIAGIFTGGVVLLALYALTDAFYWIPNATLSAIIIHAVFDLMVHPKVTYQFWKVSPIEAIIFLAAVFITVFSNIEAGIYFSIASSVALLLFRIAMARGQFLGRVEYYELINPTVISKNGQVVFDNTISKSQNISSSSTGDDSSLSNSNSISRVEKGEFASNATPLNDNNKLSDPNEFGIQTYAEEDPQKQQTQQRQQSIDNSPRYVKRYKWVPLDLENLNPNVKVLPPPPGVVVFRPNESFIYPNCSRQVDFVLDEVKRVTCPGIEKSQVIKLGDRPWNDHGPRHRKFDPNYVEKRPPLRAVVFDFSSVPYVDATGVQNLVDIRKSINRYANSDNIEYHFVGIISEWSRRALVASGFGGGDPITHRVDAAERDLTGKTRERAELFSLLENEGYDENEHDPRKKVTDEELNIGSNSVVSTNGGQPNNHILLPLVGTNTPFFHFSMSDLDYLYEELGVDKSTYTEQLND